MATANFELEELVEGAAGNSVRYNEELNVLDILCKGVIEDITLTTPPGSPVEGTMYWVAGTGATGWAGYDNQLAFYINGGWVFRTCPDEFVCFVKEAGVSNDNKVHQYDSSGTSWTKIDLS